MIVFPTLLRNEARRRASAASAMAFSNKTNGNGEDVVSMPTNQKQRTQPMQRHRQQHAVNPFSAFDDFFDMGDQMMRGFARGSGGFPSIISNVLESAGESLGGKEWRGAVKPSIDVKETDNEFVLKADLPGVTKQDVKVDVHDGVISIDAQRKTVEEEGGSGDGRHVRVERAVSFKRAMSLPEHADPSAVRASLDSGVLTVHIGKVKPSEAEARRTIEIE